MTIQDQDLTPLEEARYVAAIHFPALMNVLQSNPSVGLIESIRLSQGQGRELLEQLSRRDVLLPPDMQQIVDRFEETQRNFRAVEDVAHTQEQTLQGEAQSLYAAFIARMQEQNRLSAEDAEGLTEDEAKQQAWQQRLDWALTAYTAYRLEGRFWTQDMAQLMKSDPDIAAEIIDREKKTVEDQKTDIAVYSSAELQAAIDTADAYKKAHMQDSPSVALGMKHLDEGHDILAFGCYTQEVENKLIEYKKLKLEADTARILCGGDCQNPANNPAVKLLQQQSQLLDKIKVANEGKGDPQAALEQYNEFLKTNKDFLEALQKGDVKTAMHLAADHPSEKAKLDTAVPATQSFNESASISSPNEDRVFVPNLELNQDPVLPAAKIALLAPARVKSSGSLSLQG